MSSDSRSQIFSKPHDITDDRLHVQYVAEKRSTARLNWRLGNFNSAHAFKADHETKSPRKRRLLSASKDRLKFGTARNNVQACPRILYIHLVLDTRIIPQAISVRYGHSIGAACTPFIMGLVYVSAPIAWPIVRLLDRVLGTHERHMYTKVLPHADIIDSAQTGRAQVLPHLPPHALCDDEISTLNGLHVRAAPVWEPLDPCDVPALVRGENGVAGEIIRTRHDVEVGADVRPDHRAVEDARLAVVSAVQEIEGKDFGVRPRRGAVAEGM
ncbi:hypothetical protein B0H19DRAFT_1241583 [Mycena capillaripes]|nr:hypothetical protein B0H19DRAFT_1241583 [Mycena capillaripes]